MGLFRIKKTSLIVDVDSLLKSRGVRGRAAPRQQLQAIRMLGRFADREKFRVNAVLSGNPLDKAPHNKLTDGIRVRYVKSPEKLVSELFRAVKQAGSSAVLVTGDAGLEQKAIRSGRTVLRLSTFRKLLDEGNDSVFSGNGGSEKREGSRPGAERFRRRKNKTPNEPGQQTGRPREENRTNSSDEAISRMIDLVD